MRPIHLSMKAFGAFSDRVDIDFAALAPRGLYLVSGETGTGKTTIFDAMCWALYGRMPRKQPHEVRSDHVADTTRCEVTFTFDAGGARYTVTRNPDQFRPAAKNPDRLVKEAGAATLMRLRDDGDRSELVADKVSDVARACEEIIGLDAGQFQRVVLLPQGMFNAFLLANSKDREEILERLFGGEIYDRIVDELKTTHDACRQLVGEAESAITAALEAARGHVVDADTALDADGGHGNEPRPNVGDAHPHDSPTVARSDHEDDTTGETGDREQLGAAVTRLGGALEGLRAELTESTRRRASAQAAHHAATTGARRFDDAAELRSKIAELALKAEAVEVGRIAATVSANARPVVEAADALTVAEQAHREAVSVREDRSRAIVAVLTELGTPSEDLRPLTVQRRLAELASAHTRDHDKLDRRRVAGEAFEGATKYRAALDSRVAAVEAARATATKRAAEIDARLPDLRATAADPDSIRTAIAAAEHLVEERLTLDHLEAGLVPLSEQRARTAEEHRDLLANFTDTQAPRLALTLVDGEGCPVCGSTDHPAPATADDRHVVGWDEVTAAADRHATADTAVLELERRITELRGRLGDAAVLEPDVLRQRVDELQGDLEQATTASATIDALQGERDELDAELDRLATEAGRLGEARDQATRDLATADENRHSAEEEAAGIDAEHLEGRAMALERLGTALDGYDELVAGAASAESLLESRRVDLETRLENGDHDDVAAARAVVWTPEQEQDAIDAAQAHRSEYDRATGALKALESEGIPDARPAPEATAATLQQAEADKNRLETLVATVDFDVAGATKCLGQADQLEADSRDRRDRAEVAARAYQVCAKGGPALPVPLKRWVLAHELDRITASANVHLAGMTNGRYGLRRLRGQRDGRRSFGLDLEVDDTNTGRARSTSSLSGGEQFQASLALALGLADVISQGGTAGGQAFEALFVDEGFGSLSADALDDAVETLHRLHGSGRTVGAITHVEAMKQALHVGIEVTRRADGRGSTLTVDY